MKKLLLACICLQMFTARAQSEKRIELPTAKFMTGDDKTRSEFFFNDKDWPAINTNQNWELQGYNNYNGYAWYRIHIILPTSLKTQAWWKDSLRIFLAKIDDADEVFLNGTLIAKHGSFPTDPQGYITQWNSFREIRLSVNNPSLYWDKENIIAIRVYDGDGAGGIFGASPYLDMLGLADGLKMTIEPGNTNNKNIRLQVNNIINMNIDGKLIIKVANPENDKTVEASSMVVHLKPHAVYSTILKISPGQPLAVDASFTEKTTGRSVFLKKIPPYILTPKASLKPRINNATVFGVRPNSPFIFKIAATGEKPLQYSVTNLPKGLFLDTLTGIINGTIQEAGEYNVQLTVKNKLGIAKKEFEINCGNLLALTPPMGWNSWNCWGLSVSDAKLKESAQALIDKGLIDHGWTYMNIDDGWEAPKRNEKGEIMTNEKFPGIRSLGDWLHSKGLKFGIYSSPGTLTCGGFLGSYQHELQDAATYNNWGIDYLKYDWCSYESIHDIKDTTVASYKKPYQVMQQALRNQPRDIVYSLCQYGMKDVWKWGPDVDGNCWRTTGDIEDSWESLKSIGFNQHIMSPYAKPGRWNDPDMLIVGQVGWGDNLHPSRLTPDEQYTHISLWCLLSAPLLIGCDISKMDDFTLNLLTNDEVIAIDQDPLGRQARQVIKTDKYQVWVKDMIDGSKAVGIFNLMEDYQAISFSWTDLQLKGKFNVRDLWRQKELGKYDSYKKKVAPHGVTLIKLYR